MIHETGYSFPSSHSAVSAAVGTVLAIYVMHHAAKSTKRMVLTILCILFPLIVGASRIYLGVHYAGDVAGGWLLGYAVGCCISIVPARVRVFK